MYMNIIYSHTLREVDRNKKYCIVFVLPNAPAADLCCSVMCVIDCLRARGRRRLFAVFLYLTTRSSDSRLTRLIDNGQYIDRINILHENHYVTIN